jgi:hypothetical protein
MRDKHPSPLPVIDIEVVLNHPPVRDLKMPSVCFAVADRSHDARRFARVEDDHDCIGACPLEIGIDKVIAAAVRGLYDRDVPLL